VQQDRVSGQRKLRDGHDFEKACRLQFERERSNTQLTPSCLLLHPTGAMKSKERRRGGVSTAGRHDLGYPARTPPCRDFFRRPASALPLVFARSDKKALVSRRCRCAGFFRSSLCSCVQLLKFFGRFFGSNLGSTCCFWVFWRWFGAGPSCSG